MCQAKSLIIHINFPRFRVIYSAVAHPLSQKYESQFFDQLDNIVYRPR